MRGHGRQVSQAAGKAERRCGHPFCDASLGWRSTAGGRFRISPSEERPPVVQGSESTVRGSSPGSRFSECAFA